MVKWLVLGVGCLGVADLSGLARQLSYEGTLLNKNDWSGNFPEGAAFSVSVELDDSLSDPTPGNPDYALYNHALGAVTVSVPSAGYSVAGTAFNGGQFIIDRQARLNEPSVVAKFEVTDESLHSLLSLEVRFFQKTGSPPPSTALTQAFDIAAFRCIDFTIKSRNPDDQGSDISGFGWVRSGPITVAAAPPAPVRPGGYRLMMDFGDSLSASKDPDQSTTGDPDYFDGGYSNGPVWTQYLSWLMDIPYREDLNFSRFGGFILPPTAELTRLPTDQCLATAWSNSSLLVGIFAIVFDDGSPSAQAAIGGGINLIDHDFLLTAELVHALGIRDLLTIGTADIGVAPGMAPYLPTQELKDKLSAYVRVRNAEMAAYVTERFPSLFPGMRTTDVDPNAYLDEILADPSSFGFSNISDSVVDGGPNGSPPALADKSFEGPGADYFFWGSIAPTTKVHAQLAGRLYDDHFDTGDARHDAFRAKIVNLTGEKVWVFGGKPPAATSLELRRAGAIPFRGSIVERAFSTVDPCTFHAVDRPAGDQSFYQFHAAP